MPDPTPASETPAESVAPHRAKSRRPPPKRFRGVAPFPSFDVMTLPDTTVLSTKETSGITRLAIGRLDRLRASDPNHPLRWVRMGRSIRYLAGSVKKSLAA